MKTVLIVISLFSYFFCFSGSVHEGPSTVHVHLLFSGDTPRKVALRVMFEYEIEEIEHVTDNML